MGGSAWRVTDYPHAYPFISPACIGGSLRRQFGLNGATLAATLGPQGARRGAVRERGAASEGRRLSTGASDRPGGGGGGGGGCEKLGFGGVRRGSVWAVVMWLYEEYPRTLQPSLEGSMR